MVKHNTYMVKHMHYVNTLHGKTQQPQPSIQTLVVEQTESTFDET